MEKEKEKKLYQDAQATIETPDIEMEDVYTRDVKEESRSQTRELIISSQGPPVTRDRVPPIIRNRVPIITKNREPTVRREQTCDDACYDNASIVG